LQYPFPLLLLFDTTAITTRTAAAAAEHNKFLISFAFIYLFFCLNYITISRPPFAFFSYSHCVAVVASSFRLIQNVFLFCSDVVHNLNANFITVFAIWQAF